MNRTLWIAAPLVFCSGCCALIYQVVWTRELRFVFGGSTAASAAVISIFIAGLGFGGLWFGKRVEQSSKPLAFCARLELGIAIASALSPWLLSLVRSIYIWSGGSPQLGIAGGSAVRLLLTLLVLGPATFLMGGTLPAVARAVESDRDAGRGAVAWIYGLNTLGAVLGAALSTFFLLERFGSHASLYGAALGNLAIALAAAIAARTIDAGERAAGETSSQLQAAPSPSSDAGAGAVAPPGLIFASAAVVGFAFFLMELVWYRTLTPLLGGTIFTFGLILAVALAGIGSGSATYAVLWSRRRAPLLAFALSCALEAACIALPFALGDRIALWALLLRPFGALGFSGFVFGWTVIALTVVFPAAFVSGVQFPMLISLLGTGRARVARDIGAAYAANTLGAIAGAIAGGFGLMSLLGALGCWRLVSALLAIWGALIASVAIARAGERFRSTAVFGLAALTALLMLAQGPTAAWRHAPIGAGRVHAQRVDSPNAVQEFLYDQRRVDWQIDGVESAIAIKHFDGIGFFVNGKSDGNAREDAPTQVMGGLVGAALVPRVQRAMVIGLGTGSTAGWLARLPDIERVDVAEIEPAIRTVAKRCELVNEFALDNPKLHIHHGDARELLAVSRERYDLVFSEPSNPYRVGVASLYTREFYQAVKQRIARGGVFVQWLQTYDVDPNTVRSVFATLNSVYPHVETWFGLEHDLFLVASEHAPVYDTDALRARLSQEPFSRAMRLAWRTDSLEGFLGHYLANPAFARALAKSGVPINTDDRSPVEFGFARGLRENLFATKTVFASAHGAEQDRPNLRGGSVDWPRVDYERAAYPFVAAGSPPTIELSSSYHKRLEVLAHWSAGDFVGALQRWYSLDPEAAAIEPILIEREIVVELLAYFGQDVHEPWVSSLVPEQPTLTLAMRGVWLARHGKSREASELFAQALHQYRVDPWPLSSQMARVLALLRIATDSDRELAPLWLEALSKPFAVYVNESVRQHVLLNISRALGPSNPLCVHVLEPLEPNPDWKEDVLDFRATCYEKQNHPLQTRALEDIVLFRRDSS